MPGIDGIVAADVLRREVPGCRVLIVTTFGRPGYLRRAMEAGAGGFIVKDAPAGQLADAIRRVHAGLRVVDPERGGRPARGAGRLERRGIAARLFLGDSTVRNYLSSAIGKTGSRNRVEAVHVAEQNGWL